MCAAGRRGSAGEHGTAHVSPRSSSVLHSLSQTAGDCSEIFYEDLSSKCASTNKQVSIAAAAIHMASRRRVETLFSQRLVGQGVEADLCVAKLATHAI